MPSVSRRRTLAAAPEDIWRVLADPYALPRWWPRVTRVEAADEQGWTSVMVTPKGRAVRVDHRVVRSSAPRERAWAQQVEGTPFEGILAEAVTEARLERRDAGTEVTLASRQRLRGTARLGGFMVRRATVRLLDEALDGLERACVG
jgi:uncharacterized protein YndB with AHSA1/START domain